MAKARSKKADTRANLGFEEKLWAAADAPRNNMDAADTQAKATEIVLQPAEVLCGGWAA